jgi:hypothetical protein
MRRRTNAAERAVKPLPSEHSGTTPGSLKWRVAHPGRCPALSAGTGAAVGQTNIATICQTLGISRATLYRAIATSTGSSVDSHGGSAMLH